MILVFGGTTEGRKAAEVLEEGGVRETNECIVDGTKGTTYYYSTKTGEQDLTLHHGQRIDGALDANAMQAFCQEHGIRLIINAAHPFASQLHQTIIGVAQSLQIPVIRYERIYPPRDTSIMWLDDYRQIPHDIHSLLATTGVQSISKLKPLEAQGIKVFYRILNRPSSIALALKQGATPEQLCYYDDPKDIPVKADAILLKESGLSGGFPEKVEAAQARGMKVFALKRPELYKRDGSFCVICNGPHGLRRSVEKLLPEFFPLHSGLSTGTCATAAAVAATLRLLKDETPDEVPVILPDGETICVPVGYGDDYAYCTKEAGDDPDVTNGLEIRAYLHPLPKGGEPIVIEGGEGVGRFTLPGFDFPPGSPAINKVPREMIRQNLKELYEHSVLPSIGQGLRVCISVPQGKEVAQRTFNPRLGIEDGISIIGVSGIVKPFSETAFLDSIRKCMTVAVASGSQRIVIHSGGKSERFLHSYYPEVPFQAFVEYGNFIGDTIKIAAEQGIRQLTLGIMLGKAVKLAAGHLDTHSKKVVMDKAFIANMLQEAGITVDLSAVTLARELWTLVPQEQLQDLADAIITRCLSVCKPLLPEGELTVLLISDEGDIYSLNTLTESD